MPDIITWNVWSGGHADFFTDFMRVAEHPQTAVLCLQEVNHAFDEDEGKPRTPLLAYPQNPGGRGKNGMRLRLFEELQHLLAGEYEGYFAPQLRGYLHDCEASQYDVAFGQAMFIRRGIPHGPVTSSFSYGTKYQGNTERRLPDFGNVVVGKKSSKSIQLVQLTCADTPVILGNVHGFWSMAGKVDCAERFVQNEQIGAAFEAYWRAHCRGHPPMLLVGDLNYTSNMVALSDLATRISHNGTSGEVLNRRFGVTDTRTKLYNKPVREADYVIACPDAAALVRNLVVEHDAASDHARLRVTL
jgi:endonuclease/exonuclease/phosphatase family metal-dependent hydrolase